MKNKNNNVNNNLNNNFDPRSTVDVARGAKHAAAGGRIQNDDADDILANELPNAAAPVDDELRAVDHIGSSELPIPLT